MRMFLTLNGFDLSVSPEENYRTIIRVAAGEFSDEELARQIRANLMML
jgi:hypothetical protein